MTTPTHHQRRRLPWEERLLPRGEPYTGDDLGRRAANIRRIDAKARAIREQRATTRTYGYDHQQETDDE